MGARKANCRIVFTHGFGKDSNLTLEKRSTHAYAMLIEQESRRAMRLQVGSITKGTAKLKGVSGDSPLSILERQPTTVGNRQRYENGRTYLARKTVAACVGVPFLIALSSLYLRKARRSKMRVQNRHCWITKRCDVHEKPVDDYLRVHRFSVGEVYW